MSNIAIKVDNLSKRYRIGLKEAQPETLAGSLIGWLKSPFQNYRTLQRLSHFSSNGHEADDVLWALKDVSFDIKHGEVVGIIGRNGAGKSTLLKILSRITEPTNGRVIINGRVASLLEVGTGFHPELSGRENVYLNGTVLGMNKEEINRKFDEIVDFSGVERFIDTPVKRYSSGMQVRLAFAVAAHLEPEILLIDEVLAVGDAVFQQKSANRMGEIAKEGRTVLLVSHNMSSIRKLCQRSILLQHGEIQCSGETELIINHYLQDEGRNLQALIEIPSPKFPTAGRAIKLSILTLNNNLQSTFRLHDVWKIRLEFEIIQPLSHVIAAVGLIRNDSIPVITYWSEPQNLKPGYYITEFECELNLSACDLHFTVGISSYEQPIHYIEDVGRIRINEISISEQPVRSRGAGLLTSTRRSSITSLAQIKK